MVVPLLFFAVSGDGTTAHTAITSSSTSSWKYQFWWDDVVTGTLSSNKRPLLTELCDKPLISKRPTSPNISMAYFTRALKIRDFRTRVRCFWFHIGRKATIMCTNQSSNRRTKSNRRSGRRSKKSKIRCRASVIVIRTVQKRPITTAIIKKQSSGLRKRLGR